MTNRRDDGADELRHQTYGTLKDLVSKIEGDMNNGYWPRIGQMGALHWFANELSRADASKPNAEKCWTCGIPLPIAKNNATKDSTHSIIDEVANLVEDHGCAAEAKLLRLCKKNIPNVPFTGKSPA